MSKFTTLTEEQQRAIAAEIEVAEFPKGTVLIRQGDVSDCCYFVLKGCIRQFSVNENGKEVTSNFYTEEQAVAVFTSYKPDSASDFTFTCLEDCILVVGTTATEKEMYAKYSQLEVMTRKMIEENFGKLQKEFARFVASSPEARFRMLMEKRPELFDRAPQHQVASYLGMTPESLSRIKKRAAKPQD